jgi:hypothetical protein
VSLMAAAPIPVWQSNRVQTPAASGRGSSRPWMGSARPTRPGWMRPSHPKQPRRPGRAYPRGDASSLRCVSRRAVHKHGGSRNTPSATVAQHTVHMHARNSAMSGLRKRSHATRHGRRSGRCHRARPTSCRPRRSDRPGRMRRSSTAESPWRHGTTRSQQSCRSGSTGQSCVLLRYCRR